VEPHVTTINLYKAGKTIIFGDFEWDEDKALANLKKHGVTFEEAAEIFFGKVRFLKDPQGHDDRMVALGLSLELKLLVVVHLEMVEGRRTRIISARPGNAKDAYTFANGNDDEYQSKKSRKRRRR